MFIPENTYARNRKNPDAIVYLTTNGEICLTRDDFESEEEFLRWKAWSDQNYQEQVHHDRPFSRLPAEMGEPWNVRKPASRSYDSPARGGCDIPACPWRGK